MAIGSADGKFSTFSSSNFVISSLDDCHVVYQNQSKNVTRAQSCMYVVMHVNLL
jgi:hypothetical protein